MALRLEDFSDRELLFALEEHADGDGTVSSHELADGLGLSGLENPHQNIAIRLAWLKRYGVVERDPGGKRWALTDVGARILHGGLRARESRALTEMSEDALFAAMEVFGSRMLNAHSEAAKMSERQWRYAMAQRKRVRT
jgi:DNA-binding IclR family transcriptional regulator